MSESEYEDSRGETDVLKARVAELEALLSRRERLWDSSANNEALLGLATAALEEEGVQYRTACDETVDRRSFPADRPVGDDVTQPEVVVDTGMSTDVPASVIASSSVNAQEVVVAADCRPNGRVEVAEGFELMPPVSQSARPKVRFDSLYRTEYPETDSDNDVQFERGRERRSNRSRRCVEGPASSRPEVNSRGREDRLGAPSQNRGNFVSRQSGWDVRVQNPPQPSATSLEGCRAGQTGTERGRTGLRYPSADRSGWDMRVRRPPQPSTEGLDGCGVGLTSMGTHQISEF